MTYNEGPDSGTLKAWLDSNRKQKEAKMSEKNALMTPGEVAKLMRVDPKTVTRWAVAGKIRSVTTPGGHRRFHRDDIAELMDVAPDAL
jgi:excisionase family DNA binding protein